MIVRPLRVSPGAGAEAYKVLRTMVEACAGAKRLIRLLEGDGSGIDALGEFARLSQEIKIVLKLNGKQAAAVRLLAQRPAFHLDVEELHTTAKAWLLLRSRKDFCQYYCQ